VRVHKNRPGGFSGGSQLSRHDLCLLSSSCRNLVINCASGVYCRGFGSFASVPTADGGPGVGVVCPTLSCGSLPAQGRSFSPVPTYFAEEYASHRCYSAFDPGQFRTGNTIVSVSSPTPNPLTKTTGQISTFACRSDPHTPTASIRTCTSPGPGPSIGMSVSRNVRGEGSDELRSSHRTLFLRHDTSSVGGRKRRADCCSMGIPVCYRQPVSHLAAR
jgi:hypothetical protein